MMRRSLLPNVTREKSCLSWPCHEVLAEVSPQAHSRLRAPSWGASWGASWGFLMGFHPKPHLGLRAPGPAPGPALDLAPFVRFAPERQATAPSMANAFYPVHPITKIFPGLLFVSAQVTSPLAWHPNPRACSPSN